MPKPPWVTSRNPSYTDKMRSAQRTTMNGSSQRCSPVLAERELMRYNSGGVVQGYYRGYFGLTDTCWSCVFFGWIRATLGKTRGATADGEQGSISSIDVLGLRITSRPDCLEPGGQPAIQGPGEIKGQTWTAVKGSTAEETIYRGSMVS